MSEPAAALPAGAAASGVRLGLRENWPQFALLVLINAFVGGMVGIERTVVPLIGAEEFHLHSTTLIVSFIISFGVVKALANLVSGQLADAWGRKRVLILGWLFGLPVPFILMAAPTWSWIVAANVLLGLNQGFAWSMTVIMKVDLVGTEVARSCRRAQRIRRLPRRRHHRVSDWLPCVAVRAAAGADLSRRRLCGRGSRSVDPARARHARACPRRDRRQSASARRISASAKSLRSRHSAIATCLPLRRLGWSTI